jgi:hypothetical protein
MLTQMNHRVLACYKLSSTRMYLHSLPHCVPISDKRLANEERATERHAGQGKICAQAQSRAQIHANRAGLREVLPIPDSLSHPSFTSSCSLFFSFPISAQTPQPAACRTGFSSERYSHRRLPRHRKTKRPWRACLCAPFCAAMDTWHL